MQLRPTYRRRQRIAAHLVGVAALTGTAVLLTDAPSHATTDARPDVFTGDAVASAFHLQLDKDPQLFPVSDPLHVEIPFATTSLDSSGGSTARAATAYPGAAATGLGSLMCTFNPGACAIPFPQYPLMATASYPTTPDARTHGDLPDLAAGPFSVTPDVAVAHARPDSAEANTKASGIELQGVVSVDTATTRTRQAFEGSTLVVTAESGLKGIDIGGGQLHIDALRSIAVSRVDGQKVTTATATTAITGATAGGTPVTIDSTGIHVAGNGDGGQASSGLNSALAQLKQAGIEVGLAAPTQSAKDGTGTASTGGLLVGWSKPVDDPGLPSLPVSAPVQPTGVYFGSISLGGAGVNAFASPPEIDVPWTGPLPVDQPSAPASISSPVTPALSTTGGAPQLGTGGSTGIPPTVTQHKPHAGQAAALGVDLSSERLRVLALVLAGYPALVLLLSPLHARPRRRRENVTLA